LITLKASTQEMSNTTFCIERKALEQVRHKVIDLLQKRQKAFEEEQDKKLLFRLEEHFQQVDLQVYLQAVRYMEKSNQKCKNIASWSLIEMYLNHEPLRLLYLVIETTGEKFYAVVYDERLKKGKYLGKIKKDYFSKMISFIFPNSKGSVDENYIMYAKFSNNSVVEVDIATDVNLWTINQIALLETVLFE